MIRFLQKDKYNHGTQGSLGHARSFCDESDGASTKCPLYLIVLDVSEIEASSKLAPPSPATDTMADQLPITLRPPPLNQVTKTSHFGTDAHHGPNTQF
jgi:hypothetical protein